MRLGLGTDILVGYRQPLFGGVPFLLDTYTGAAAAYSLRQLRTGVTNVVRVRRDTTPSAEQDFTAEEITDGTLLAFVGAGNNGYVVTWYDQSGNGNNATQSTAANQPKIVDAGVLVTENGKPAIDFNGTDDSFATTSGLYSSQITLFSALNITTDTPLNYGRIFHLTDGSNSYQITRTNSFANFELVTKNTEYNLSTDSLNWGVHTGHLLLSAVTNNSTDSDSIYIDSSQKTELGTNITVGGGNNSPSTIGVRNDLLSLTHFDGSIQELLIFDSDQSSNRAAIETNINEHYSIYT